MVLSSVARASQGNIDPPPPDAVAAAQERLTTLAISGDARAQYMLSQALQGRYNLLPMCAFTEDGSIPAPKSDAERQFFEWVKSEFARGNPNLAAASAATADITTFNQATDSSLCELGRLYLLAHASVQNFAAAQLELSHEPAPEGPPSATVGWIEARPAAELLAAATSQGYAPAKYEEARGAIECRSEDGSPGRAEGPQWARLEHIAEAGYRPAMAELATLILVGCAPSDLRYEEARTWLERASAGMELDP